MYIIKISKTFVSFLRTSGEYSKNIDKDPFTQRILKTDPCPMSISIAILNVLDFFYQNNIESGDIDKDPFS